MNKNLFLLFVVCVLFNSISNGQVIGKKQLIEVLHGKNDPKTIEQLNKYLDQNTSLEYSERLWTSPNQNDMLMIKFDENAVYFFDDINNRLLVESTLFEMGYIFYKTQYRDQKVDVYSYMDGNTYLIRFAEIEFNNERGLIKLILSAREVESAELIKWDEMVKRIKASSNSQTPREFLANGLILSYYLWYEKYEKLKEFLKEQNFTYFPEGSTSSHKFYLYDELENYTLILVDTVGKNNRIIYSLEYPNGAYFLNKIKKEMNNNEMFKYSEEFDVYLFIIFTEDKDNFYFSSAIQTPKDDPPAIIFNVPIEVDKKYSWDKVILKLLIEDQ